MCIRDRNNVVLPSAWNENVKWGCESDFERQSEIEIFEVNSGYKGLIKKLNIERIVKKDLPYGRNSTVANDGYIDDNENKYLPGDRISVLVTADYYEDEIINYVITTNNTKGDLTTHRCV